MKNQNEDHDYEYSTVPSQEKLERLKEQHDLESTEDVYDDPLILKWDWETTKEAILYDIKNVVGEKVKVSGHNLGWNSQQGKTLNLDYDEVLDKITINKDFTLYIYIDEENEHITIKRTDHDSPTLSQANTFRIDPQ